MQRVADSITAIFAKRLKEARATRGLSQRALGGLVATDKDTGSVRVNRYEQQVNKADMESAAELARVLEVPVAYLFTDADDLAELILVFSRLSAGERASILAGAKEVAQKSA